MAKQYDRSAEDLGNIVGLEHVNLLVPDQGLATLFYISGLGLTRDPYLMTSVDNMWVNVGQQPVPPADRQGAEAARPHGAGDPRPRPAAEAAGEHEEAARAAPSSPSRSTTTTSRRPARGATSTSSTSRRSASPAWCSACPMSSSTCRRSTAKGIADFYSKVLGTMTSVKDDAAHVSVGYGQELVFRETDKTDPGL